MGGTGRAGTGCRGTGRAGPGAEVGDVPGADEGDVDGTPGPGPPPRHDPATEATRATTTRGANRRRTVERHATRRAYSGLTLHRPSAQRVKEADRPADGSSRPTKERGKTMGVVLYRIVQWARLFWTGTIDPNPPAAANPRA